MPFWGPRVKGTLPGVWEPETTAAMVTSVWRWPYYLLLGSWNPLQHSESVVQPREALASDRRKSPTTPRGSHGNVAVPPLRLTQSPAQDMQAIPQPLVRPSPVLGPGVTEKKGSNSKELSFGKSALRTQILSWDIESSGAADRQIRRFPRGNTA